jgi:hypothetical protein
MISVVKIALPHSILFLKRINGHILDLLDYRVQFIRTAAPAIVTRDGPAQSLKAVHFVYALLERTTLDPETKQPLVVEDHRFMIAETDIVLPELDFEVQYIATTLLGMPDGSHREFHLFHGGTTDEFVGKELPNFNTIQEQVKGHG